MLLAVSDNDELERLVQAQSPRSRAMLEKLGCEGKETGDFPPASLAWHHNSL
jgi:hypothetical protein